MGGFRRALAGALLMLVFSSAQAYGPMYNMGNLGILDSSWYYNAILNQNVENARLRQQGRQGQPQAGLVTQPSASSTAAAKLASSYPEAGRAEAERTFAALLRSYGQIEQRFSIAPGDLGGAAAAFIAGCYMALHGVAFPDEHFAVLVRQLQAVVASQPGFLKVSAADKRDAYEQLAIIGMFMASTQMGLEKKPNAEIAQGSRTAARRYLSQFFKGDVDRLKLSAQGLSLQ